MQNVQRVKATIEQTHFGNHSQLAHFFEMMSSRDLVERHNVHLAGKEHSQEREQRISIFICLQKCPDVVKVLEDNLLRPSK